MIDKRIGRRIKERREELGMTQDLPRSWALQPTISQPLSVARHFRAARI